MSEKSLLILQVGTSPQDVRENFGDLPSWFCRALDRAVETVQIVRVFEDEALPPPDPNCPVIITGSWAMVTDLLPWSERTAEWIREAYKLGVPLLGVCYGHQLMAHALGGRVDYHPLGREVGCQKIILSKNAVQESFFAEFPSEFIAHLTHEQSVMELPVGAEVLGGSFHDPNQIIRYGPNALSTQFHPEFTVEINTACLKRREDVLTSEGKKIDELLSGLKDTPVARNILSKFVAENSFQSVGIK